MKKIISGAMALCVFTFLCAFNLKKHSGGQVGTTGSPGEGTCSGCHGGGPAGTTVSITAVPDFTANVFDPTTIYTITIKVSHPSLTKFGFNCEILSPANVSAGTMANGSPGIFFFNFGGKNNATHNGTQTGIGSFSWSFEWTPPLVGNATIYAAGNAVNLDGGTNGDRAASSILNLTQVNTGLNSEQKNQISQITLFPNPANDFTSISYYLTSTQKVTIELMDVGGKIVKTFVNENYETGPHQNILDLKGISKGMYFVKTSANGEKVSQKLISIH